MPCTAAVAGTRLTCLRSGAGSMSRYGRDGSTAATPNAPGAPSERLPELVAPHARRTARLAEAQGQVGAALGGEAAARLLHHLAMPASPDTVLRLIRGLPLPAPEPPRVVAVDDWALRKGRTCGTIVVDLERRRTIALLPDRTSTTVADWLRQRPGIKVVARDRSTEYARAAAIGAPKAVQVADRWRVT